MSLSKAEAARLNGAKSRGPKTAEGKLKSAMNSTKHGLASLKLVVLDNESGEGFQNLLCAFIEKYQPRDAVELEVVTEAAAARWRLKRLLGIETALFDLEMASQQEAIEETFEHIDGGARQALAFKALADESNSLALLNRYETRIRRSYESAMRELRRAITERTQATVGQVLDLRGAPSPANETNLPQSAERTQHANPSHAAPNPSRDCQGAVSNQLAERTRCTPNLSCDGDGAASSNHSQLQ
jgi:hypothetical protein